MSKTQQEIAAPKACNKTLVTFVLFLTAVFFIALAAFAVYAKKTALFTENTVLAAVILVLLLWLLIAVVTWAYLLKIRRPLYIILIFAAFAAAVIFYLISVSDAPLFSGKVSFTKNMLVLLLCVAAIIAYSFFCISRYRDSKNSVFAVVFALIMTIPQLFSTMFANGINFAANVWGIAGGSVVAALCSFFICVYFVGKEKKQITTKWLTYCAALAALSVVFKIMGNSVSFIPSMRFTLTYIPWVVSGIVLGPAGGMVTAAIGDVLGQLILPAGIGALNPLLTLSNALFALFPAVLYRYSPIKKDWLNLLAGMAISTLFCTFGFSSIVLWQLLSPGITFWEYFIPNRLPQGIIIAVNYGLIVALLPALKRAKINNLKFLEFRTATKNV